MGRRPPRAALGSWLGVLQVSSYGGDCPIQRLRAYLDRRSLWSDAEEEALTASAREEVLTCFAKAEKEKKPPLREMFTDVYDVMPENLREQHASVMAHISKYPDQYPSWFADE